MEMAHKIETIAWTNEVPWHGLGVKVDDNITVDDMIIKAGLDWTVEKHPIFAKVGEKYTRVPNQFALVRDRDGRVLDTIGSQWNPIQNKDAFSFFKEFVEAGDAKMETMGSLRDGKYVWGLANLGNSFKLNIPGKPEIDEVKGYLLVGNPHQYGAPMICRFTSIRVVCNNTLTLALQSSGKIDKHLPEFKTGHRIKFDESVMKRAKETMGLAREKLDEFRENAEILQKISISDEEARLFLAKFYDPQKNIIDIRDHFEERASKPLQKVYAAYSMAPGAQVGNGWGLLNAITYYTDHLASGNNDNIRFESALIGYQAKIKERALEELLAAA